ncbi:hypothetical protein CEXT_799571, partial [Caerostris extrusa]
AASAVSVREGEMGVLKEERKVNTYQCVKILAPQVVPRLLSRGSHGCIQTWFEEKCKETSSHNCQIELPALSRTKPDSVMFYLAHDFWVKEEGLAAGNGLKLLGSVHAKRGKASYNGSDHDHR